MLLRFVVCAALLAASSAVGISAQPVASDVRVRNFNSVAISPDGTRLVSLETPDAGPDSPKEPQPTIVIRTLATGQRFAIDCPPKIDCILSNPVWSPDGARLAYLEHTLKSNESRVWTVAADGSDAKPWLRGYKGQLERPLWSSDGKSLALLATANAHKNIGATQPGVALVGDIADVRAADEQRIAVLDAGGTLRYASPADLFVYEYDWLPSGRGFVATGAHGNGDNNWWVAKLYAIDAAGTATAIFSPPEQINAPKVSPDGKTVAFIAGLMSDFGSVGGDILTVPVSGGTASDVTPGMAASADSISWGGRNDRITFTALAGDLATIQTVDVATKHLVTLWSAPETIGGYYANDSLLRVSFARDGSTSAIIRQSFVRPPEIYVGPLGRWHAVTHDNDAIPAPFKAQSVTWTNEGFGVQGWLVGPQDVAAGKLYPMVVDIHGGPSAAATPRFLPRGETRDMLERGYFVFFPNPRGSFGQGERFTAANVRDFGYGDLRDILTGIDAAEKVAPIDEKRLAVGGFSYGGYMTMWAVTQTHRFKAAFAGAGVANWQSYYGQNGIDQWMIPFFGASVYDDPAIYARSSPITFIKNVKTPTFVFVGERDVECPMAQSLEFWHALDALGVPVSFVVYAGEGHGIRKPSDRKDYERRIIAWLDRYLAP